MYKLNNHGWGLGTLLAFISFLVLVLLIVAIISFNYGVDHGANSNNNQQTEENTFVSP